MSTLTQPPIPNSKLAKTEHSEEEINTLLLNRGTNIHRPSLETRVAYQWENEGDLLGYFNNCQKNELTLKWLSDALPSDKSKAAALDVGCAYGNMLLMLHARLGKPAGLHLVGVDLYPESMEYAQAFSRWIPGYERCEYQVGDLSKQLPFDEAAFDVVNLGDVLEHMVEPEKALRELARITKPGGVILVCTPLKNSLFKRLASALNALSGGKLYRAYYKGKDNTDLGADGKPIMETRAGLDHVSEMTLPELKQLFTRSGFSVERMELMPVMSGSHWFKGRLFLQSAMLFLEAIHSKLRLASWAHSAMFFLRLPQ